MMKNRKKRDFASREMVIYAQQWASVSALNDYGEFTVDPADAADFAAMQDVFTQFRVTTARLLIVPRAVHPESSHGTYGFSQLADGQTMSSSLALLYEEIPNPRTKMISMGKARNGQVHSFPLLLEDEDKEWRDVETDETKTIATIGYGLFDHGFGTTVTRQFDLIVILGTQFRN
jgi:hypothetical protein